MKNIFKNILFTLILLIFITNPSIIYSSVNNTLDLFIKTIFPTLFPFFILSDILFNYNYFSIFNHIKIKYLSVILFSMITALPTNAKYIKELLDNHLISTKEAALVLSFTLFPSIVYVHLISPINYIYILFIVYLSNIIFYLLNYKKLSNINYKNVMEKKSLFTLLKHSILKNITALCTIFGILLFFNIIINIASNYFYLNDLISTVIASILEFTNGINLINGLKINNYHKLILIVLTLSFSSFSILFQCLSVLENYKISLISIIKNKIIITIISFLLLLII